MTQPSRHAHRAYVLVTAAYNEEALIEKPMQSVIAQTLRPARWVIVSDGSTDRTDEIVQSYAAKYPFIHHWRMPERHSRQFATQVYAINTGFAQCSDLAYGYMGNLDADISLEPAYFERLIEVFEQDPGLGLAGGVIYEQQHGEFRARNSNTVRSVALGVQLFRRECFEALGGCGYAPLPYGGPDWYAEVRSRMAGWEVRAVPELKAYHHRPTGTASNILRYWYSQGLMDFTFGSDPLFEIAKLARRIPEKPYLFGSLTRLAGFASAYLRGEQRLASRDFVDFLRAEQRTRLRTFIRNGAWQA